MPYSQSKSLRKTFAILECINEARDGIAAAEVARLTGIPSATTHRILCDLVSMGYLQWDKRSKAYCIGC